jgi:hypothetical protein
MSSYYESAEGETITKARAIKELRDHGQTDENIWFFLNDKDVGLGDRETYDAQAVLRWLGY